MDSRLTVSNMAIEAGAKAGIFGVDDVTRTYINGRLKRTHREFTSDAGATYRASYQIDVSTIEPQVAFPHLPSNAKPISQVGEVPIDQVDRLVHQRPLGTTW